MRSRRSGRREAASSPTGTARVPAMFDEAMACHRAGRMDMAERICRRILAVEPRHADGLHLLGVIAMGNGRHAQAVDWIGQAVAASPANAAFHSNLGTSLQSLGRLEDAEACHRKAVELAPNAYFCHYNLGNALLALGQAAEAAACFRHVIRLRPDHVRSHTNLGSALREMGEVEQAEACQRRAIAISPDFAEAHLNLGNVLQAMERLEEAAEYYDLATRLRPDLAEAHAGLGNVLQQSGRVGAAEECFRRAVRLAPARSDFHTALGGALVELGRREEGAGFLSTAVELDPENMEALAQGHHQNQHLCRWDGLEQAEERILDLVRRGREGVSPFLLLAMNSTAADQLVCARLLARRLGGAATLGTDPVPAPRIRLGYLSADFREHPVARMITGMIKSHDRDRFEVVGYSIGRDDGGPTRQALVKAFDRFVDLRPLTDRRAAERIRDDGIDILVDLGGYISDNRSRILTWRPAPIQVNYFGYPGSMGANFIDYIVGDRVVIPSGHQESYEEKVVRLPGNYMPFDPGRDVADVPSRAECGLPDDAFVFSAFHASYKISRPVFSAWMRLLAAVPGSVLWLLTPSDTAKSNLLREAEACGIAADRLIFAAKVPAACHLARQRLAGLYLDVLPYNAHTTAAEALWMGVPMVSCLGETFASRVGGSLLNAIGLRDLAVNSLDEYEALARRLATDPAALAEVKARLAAARDSSPFFDAGRRARDMEAAFARMIEIHRAGRAPESFDISRD